MSGNKCPNINSKEWQDLLNELNGNRLLAMKAFNDNKQEIPEVSSGIVQNLKLKSKVNFGPEIHTVKKNDWMEEDYYETNDKTKINRVGNFVKNFSSKNIGSRDFIQEKADMLWEGKDHDDKIRNENGEMETYDEYVDRRREYMKIGAAKGKVLHLAIEMVLNNNVIDENKRRIKEILNEFSDEKNETPFYWEWILDNETDGDGNVRFTNIEKIFDNLGLNYFKDTGDAFNDMLKDSIETEVSVAVPEINLAGTIDMLVQHSDNTYSIVDWKTGKNFSGRADIGELFLMRYGDQGNKEITDNFRNRAKIQLAMYAILLKANNHGMKFRDLQIGWIPNEYIIQQRDVDAAVEVGSFIPMIEEMLKDKKFLKENGLDVDMRKKLLEKDANIFNPSHYSSITNTDSVYDEIVTKGKAPQQVLEEKVEKLRYITSKNISFSALSQEDQQKAMQLSDEITEMLTEGNIVITKDSYHDMNMMEKYLGNYSEVTHPAVKAWKFFKNSREEIANRKAEEKIHIFQSLLRPVVKEMEKEQGTHNLLENKNFDYEKMYAWAYVDVVDEDDQSKSRERLLTNQEEDPELQERWKKLSPAKKKLLMYINNTFKDYFEGEDAFMNSTATLDANGNEISQLDLYNKKKKKMDKRVYYDGFFFKLPITKEEVILKAGGGSYIKGSFNKEAMGRLAYEKATMFKEKEYENWFDDTNAIPVKYLGNEYIDTSKLYTKNIEFIFKRAVTEMERTEQMQDVYALGISLRNKLAIEKDPNYPLEPMYKNLVSFLDAKLIHDVQKRTKPIKWMRTKKVRIPMLNPKTGKMENYPVSMDKALSALRSYGSAVTMWAKPFQGLGNGIHAIELTHREALKGTIGKMKFLGISGDVLDFDLKAKLRAEKEYATDFMANAIKGNVNKSKLYLIAKHTNYFGNNFDFTFLDRESLTKRNKYFSNDVLYSPYSIPEEFVTLSTMGAALMHMKNEKTGKSLYDSYEKYEILDENGKGTGEYAIRWIGGIRGKVKKGSGDATYYETLGELSEKEIAHIKKVHERLQGGYRREESLAIEAYSLGKVFVQLKKYFPRLLLNGMHRKRSETDLGSYKRVVDEKGNEVMVSDNGEEMPLYEWIARTTEGRWLTVGRFLANIVTLGHKSKQYGWNSLNDEQKTNLVEASLTFGQWMMYYGLYLTLFADIDDDDTTKKMWKQYLVDNLTQQYNVVDLFRTAKTIFTPIALSKVVDLAMNGTNMMFSTANYALGNDDLALTKNGDLRGWNNFAKDVPYLASFKDLSIRFENDKTGVLSWADWMYDGVRMK